jgi:pimeloyl-ACP methyl ester carboxylesterase
VAVCGVSFGGLIAVRYAAARPDQVSALIIVSTPGPSWRPDARVARYVHHPVLLAPLFVASALFRLGPEVVASYDGWPARARFVVRHTARVLAAPMSPTRMSERVRLAASEDFGAACRAVRAPTLVVTGESGLDRVVPTSSTREHLDAIPGARAVTFERTGHIGLITRPERFAEIVGTFVEETAGRQAWTSKREA